MFVNKLVRMANQIAMNLDHGRDQEDAVVGTPEHAKRFWTPEMRRQIVERFRHGSNGSSEVAELSPIAAEAIGRLAEEQVAA